MTIQYGRPSKQRGIALITVLFMFALAAIVISGVVTMQGNNVERASSMVESEQAYLLCLSGEEWARQLLAEDFLANPAVDHLNEKWALPGNILPVDNGYIEVSIQDAQGLFNLNNLISNTGVADPNYRLAFQNFLDVALHDQSHSRLLSSEAADWLDNNTADAESADYMSAAIPYRAANGPVTDISELRWLKDMDVQTYRVLSQQLFPYLIALPKIKATSGATRVNINTVSAPVVAAILGIDLGDAEKAVQAIQANKNGLSSVAEAAALFPATQQSLLGTNAVTYSEYFQVRVRARFADHYAFLTSLIYRDHQKGTMTILSRDRSERFIFPFSKDYNGNLKTKDYEFTI